MFWLIFNKIFQDEANYYPVFIDCAIYNCSKFIVYQVEAKNIGPTIMSGRVADLAVNPKKSN